MTHFMKKLGNRGVPGCNLLQNWKVCIYLDNTPSTPTPTPMNVSYKYIKECNRRCCILAAHWSWWLRAYTQYSTWKGKTCTSGGNTIHRIELCAAVLGVEVSELLWVPSECFRFYTHSQIVLSYLKNTTRRFYVYVSNRVSRIHLSALPNRWTHVATEQNPADQTTRSVSQQLVGNLTIMRYFNKGITRTSVAIPIVGIRNRLSD